MRWRRFLYLERVEDHAARFTENHTIRQMGSMSHMDIAQYLSHELEGRVVCTSTVGRGMWYYYKWRAHRWTFDREGTQVLLMCHRILQRYCLSLRKETFINTPAHEDAIGLGLMDIPVVGPEDRKDEKDDKNKKNGEGTPKPRRLASIPRLVNTLVEDQTPLREEILIHLDIVAGDMRQLQSILRALAALLYDESFSGKLDTLNEHFIPFNNGVLDLESLELRPGRPDDMVMRGPTYDWFDYDAHDVHVQELERILTTIFPDRAIRDFYLDAAATVLRRRNRYKHFYVMTGGTNGGKSLLLSIMRAAFGNLAGQLPIEALTRKGGDASNQTDYLAKTAGQAFVVCNEPDGSSDVLQADRIKQLISDSDHLSARHLRQTFEGACSRCARCTVSRRTWRSRSSCGWRATPHRPSRAWTQPTSSGRSSYPVCRRS